MPKFDQLVRALQLLDVQFKQAITDICDYTRKARKYAFERALLCIELSKNHMDQIRDYCKPLSIQEWMDKGFLPLSVINARRSVLFQNIELGMTKEQYIEYGDTWVPKSKPRIKNEVKFVASASRKKAHTSAEQLDEQRAKNRELRLENSAITLEIENLRRQLEQGGDAKLKARIKELEEENKSLRAENKDLKTQITKFKVRITNMTSMLSFPTPTKKKAR